MNSNLETLPSLLASYVSPSPSLSCLKVRQLSVSKTYPKFKPSVTFDFNPTPIAKKIDKPPTKTRFKHHSKLAAKCCSRHRSKQHNYDHTQKEDIDYTLRLLDSLPLPAHYKTKHLLDKLANLPAADLPAYVEPVSLNTVNVQITCIPSADILPWHPDDDDTGYQNRWCQVK